jgi:hypothetical protein
MPFQPRTDDFFKQRRAAMVALKKQGKSFREIANAMNLPLHTVQYAMKQAKAEGIVTSFSLPSGTFWTPEKFAEFLHLWTTTNLSMSLIGEKIGANKNQIAGLTMRRKLPPRPEGCAVEKSSHKPKIGEPHKIITREAQKPKERTFVAKAKAARASSQVGSKFKLTLLYSPPSQRVRQIVAQQQAAPREPHKRCLYTSGDRANGFVCCDELVDMGSICCSQHRAICTTNYSHRAREGAA